MSKTPSPARNKVSLFTHICLLALSTLLILPSPSPAQQNPPIAAIAKAYGVDSFGQIETIRYTFNAEFPGAKLARAWEWSPKSDTISYEGKDKAGNPVKASYKRSELSSQTDAIKAIDPIFSNDQYWLILPFHILWDGVAVTDDGTQKLAIGDGSAQRLVAKYTSGGYQPGDTWDLYVGPDKRVQEIVYHRGAPTPPPQLVMATYTDYKKAGPLLISMDHKGTLDGKPFRLFFTDVSVKLTGSDKWINAE